MSMESPTGKSKKSKASHLEFDFDNPSATDSGAEKPEVPSPIPEKIDFLPEKPFGKPISSDFEKEPENDSPPESPSPLLKGTAIGSFKAQSTVIPSKSKSVPPENKFVGKEVFKEVFKETVQETEKKTLLTPLPPMETPMSSQIPSMSDFRRNAERQSKEQKTTGNILSGIAYALLAVIMIVASLSAFGGYVMWRQIQSQATTVAQLSDKLNNEVAVLRDEAAITKKNADENFRRQQEILNKTIVSLEQQRANFLAEQKKKDREILSLQGRLTRIENRINSNR